MARQQKTKPEEKKKEGGEENQPAQTPIAEQEKSSEAKSDFQSHPKFSKFIKKGAQ